MKYKKLSLLVCVLVFILMTGCDEAEQVQADEIQLRIQLDLQEDIGLLLLDHTLDTEHGNGGMSNADKSPIRRNDTLYWSFNKVHMEHPVDTANLTLQFTVVTEYCDPNYDNLYPEAYTIPLDALSFRADFGHSYGITITGDKLHGYVAAIDTRDA